MKKLPDVPTFFEQGVTDVAFQVRGCICLVGPAAMPKEIVLKLSDMMVELGKSERIQKILDHLRHRHGGQDHVYLREVPRRGRARLDRAGEGPEHGAAVGGWMAGLQALVFAVKAAAAG